MYHMVRLEILHEQTFGNFADLDLDIWIIALQSEMLKFGCLGVPITIQV
jgi:hypothetical protein